jgi:hypothetical protein
VSVTYPPPFCQPTAGFKLVTANAHDAAVTHAAEQHCSALLHVTPHPPQLSGSLSVGMHVPVQQSFPVPHALPHAPQFIGSEPSDVHAPEQLTWPIPQEAPSTPPPSSCPLPPSPDGVKPLWLDPHAGCSASVPRATRSRFFGTEAIVR